MIVSGEAGTGKLQVLKAFDWCAFQHDKQQMLCKTAYMWRAATLLNTSASMGYSTHHVFGLSTFTHQGIQSRRPKPQQTSNQEARAQSILANVRFVLIDEYSTLDLDHFWRMHIAANRVSNALHKPNADNIFGGMHGNFFGDPRQHDPIGGHPLYTPVPTATDIPKQKKLSAKCITARQLWTSFSDVFLLTEQHRQSKSPSAMQLQQACRMFERRTTETASQQETQQLCDLLNSRAIQSIDDIDDDVVHCIVLRHVVGTPLNRQLAFRHANRTNRRIYVWTATDVCTAVNMDESLAYQLLH